MGVLSWSFLVSAVKGFDYGTAVALAPWCFVGVNHDDDDDALVFGLCCLGVALGMCALLCLWFCLLMAAPSKHRWWVPHVSQI